MIKTDFGRNRHRMSFAGAFTALVFSTIFSTNVLAYVTPHQYYDPVRHLLVNMADTRWDLSAASELLSKNSLLDKSPSMDDGLQFIARSPIVTENAIQPTLTMRVDRGQWTSARGYAERWLKDFPKFGYDLQMSRDSTIGTLSGFDMEFKSKTSHRIARQFIVQRPHEMWVFTCSGDDQSFEREWPACEKILKTAEAH